MSTRLYVGNLNFRTTEESLEALFSNYGQVEDVAIITDRDTGRSRGFGFVTMEDEGPRKPSKRSTAPNSKAAHSPSTKPSPAKNVAAAAAVAVAVAVSVAAAAEAAVVVAAEDVAANAGKFIRTPSADNHTKDLPRGPSTAGLFCGAAERALRCYEPHVAAITRIGPRILR